MIVFYINIYHMMHTLLFGFMLEQLVRHRRQNKAQDKRDIGGHIYRFIYKYGYTYIYISMFMSS